MTPLGRPLACLVESRADPGVDKIVELEQVPGIVTKLILNIDYMQGSLSASLDQINWVLTSYIVASAIMTAPIGWVAERFGRKRLFVICAAGFTFASALCGFAQTIEQMVAFRLLQGAFGAALVPLSQSVMLDSYSARERGSAMAIWGIGVMLGPIMGPTLGAWLTDNYSWQGHRQRPRGKQHHYPSRYGQDRRPRV